MSFIFNGADTLSRTILSRPSIEAIKRGNGRHLADHRVHAASNRTILIDHDASATIAPEWLLPIIIYREQQPSVVDEEDPIFVGASAAQCL